MITAENSMRLCDLCAFQAGFTARERLEPREAGGQFALQLRDLREGAFVDVHQLQRFDLQGLSERYMVNPGDVVFRSRGASNTAFVMPVGCGEPVFALMPLLVLRPIIELIAPEYLAWAINQADAQRQIDAEAQGTSMRMIPKQALEQVEIPVPDLKTQRLIVETSSLAAAEFALLQRLAVRRAVLINHMLSAAAHGGAQQKGVRQ
jgi:hypothetical protein